MNVAIESSPSVTPFILALELCPSVNFWIGAVLLGCYVYVCVCMYVSVYVCMEDIYVCA